MKSENSQISFEIEITKDGSPTLRLSSNGESMHHSWGAARETNYIYRAPIATALELYPNSSACVVGLGIGYIEMAWAHCKPAVEAKLVSFETNLDLKRDFMQWLEAGKAQLFEQACSSLEKNSQTAEIRARLALNFTREPIRGDVREAAPERWNIVCYDAFSSKTSQELWDETYLRNFVKKHCAVDCVFTSYAQLGRLKRVLDEAGFKFVERAGFPGKRNSTLALRGLFKASEAAFQTS